MDTTAIIHSSTPDVIAQLTTRITDLEASLATELQKNDELQIKHDRLVGDHAKYLEKYRYNEACVDQFMDTLLTYVASDEIDSDVAEELADCFGRDLTRKVYVNIDISGELELVLPAGVDLESAIEELDFGPNVHYASGIQIEYSDISNVSFQEVK